MPAAGVSDVRSRYIDLLQKSVANAIYGESAFDRRLRRLLQRLRHPIITRRCAPVWPAQAHTMLNQRRLANLRELAERAIRENVPGDFIEAGIWRGGACILMRGILAAYEIRDRRVFCADSFEGLPPPDREKYPQDRRDRLFKFRELAVSEDAVRSNFAAYGLLDEQVVFVKGLFRDTMPRLNGHRFALIRVDGDMYESTMDVLANLYDRLSPGGFVIIDDYGALSACRRAVHDFIERRGLTVEIMPVDGCTVWWQKA